MTLQDNHHHHNKLLTQNVNLGNASVIGHKVTAVGVVRIEIFTNSAEEVCRDSDSDRSLIFFLDPDLSNHLFKDDEWRPHLCISSHQSIILTFSGIPLSVRDNDEQSQGTNYFFKFSDVYILMSISFLYQRSHL